ncbi:MAG: PDZ domain-containing protein, partial [Negativicutes bacterium]|nr:PDZ domain-containing protein [Negativicutes bacterium]
LGLAVYTDAAEGKERAKLKWTQNTGAVVSDVIANSPAAAAGLQAGDIILTFGGMEVTGGRKLLELAAALVTDADKADYAVDVSFVRKGANNAGQIKLVNPNYNIDRIVKNAAAPAPVADKPGFGISVRAVTAEDVKTMSLSAVQGLLVTEVKKNSLAEKMNIRPDDVVIEVNGTAINTTEQLKQVLAAGAVTAVKVVRAGSTLLLEAPVSF